ncbi:peptidyl-prolyl cis-trans isomerase [Bacteroidia bacterium]|nr:peptidyl-prolyl cis-trans isomerase [Bacteroidia bacterium]
MICNGVLLAQKNDPVLMTVGGDKVQLSEFEYLYNKNNAGNVTDKKTLLEYVDMFTIFKLKVEDAKAKGLDTTYAFKAELKQYRDQLAQQYLTDAAAQQAIVQEAYNFMKEDLDVSHILIALPPQATPADTLAAYNKAVEVRLALKQQPFDSVAKKYSADRMVQQNGGHFGWLTAFSTIYPFEKAAYALKAGEISQPVRSQVGYHIIKVNARRQDPGEVYTAHIFKALDKEHPENNEKSAGLMDSIYNRLLAGEAFGKLALDLSDDRSSAQRGGELQPFKTGQMIPAFEQQAFALQNIGDISKPFETAYGWHIIKLLGKKPLGTFDELKPQIERQIQRDERAQTGKNAFIGKLKARYKPVIVAENLSDYYPFVNTDGINYPLDTAFFKNVEKFNKPILKINGKTYTQRDMNAYMSVFYPTQKTLPEDIIADKAREFEGRKLLDLEDAQLENKYPDFRNLIREYHDGILLFDNSNREVWERSQTDTTGLKTYFVQNKNKYVWEKPHFKGTIVYCKDLQTYQKAQRIAKELQPFEKELLNTLNNDSVQLVRLDKGLYAQGDNKEVDKQIFNIEENYEPDKAFPYSFVSGKNLGNTPEEYTEVRGQVSADYQELLEKEWIKSLQAKYPVKIDEKILKMVKEN